MIGHVIHEWADRPFEYGRFDCCQFAGEVIAAQTGENPMHRLHYTSEREAYRIINQYGSLEKAMRHFLGEPIAVADAKHGDVLLIDTDQGEASGVVYLGQAVIRHPNGLRSYDLSCARLAWSI